MAHTPFKHHPRQLWINFNPPKGKATLHNYKLVIAYIIEHNFRILKNWTTPSSKWSPQQRKIAHNNLFLRTETLYLSDYDIVNAATTLVENWDKFTDAYPMNLPNNTLHEEATRLYAIGRTKIDDYREAHDLYPISWDILIASNMAKL
jgi:hypothetical protein